MIKRLIKWVLRVVGCMLLLALLFYGFIHIVIQNRINKIYHVSIENIPVPADSISVEKGRHLVAIKGCAECHGDNFGGKIMNDDAIVGRIVGPNLTSGRGGLPADYDTKDWIAALKHGLRKDRKPLLFMPSNETAQLSEEDMKAVIAFCKQLEPVNNEVPKTDIVFLARILGYFDQLPLIPAEKIDHEQSLTKSIDTTSPVAFGRYLGISCQSCHRGDLKGGEPIAPGMPPVPDLTSTGVAGKWTYNQFKQVLQTGRRPDGRQLDNSNMPWKITASYTTNEIEALYQYLKSLK